MYGSPIPYQQSDHGVVPYYTGKIQGHIPRRRRRRRRRRRGTEKGEGEGGRRRRRACVFSCANLEDR